MSYQIFPTTKERNIPLKGQGKWVNVRSAGLKKNVLSSHPGIIYKEEPMENFEVSVSGPVAIGRGLIREAYSVWRDVVGNSVDRWLLIPQRYDSV